MMYLFLSRVVSSVFLSKSFVSLSRGEVKWKERGEKEVEKRGEK